MSSDRTHKVRIILVVLTLFFILAVVTIVIQGIGQTIARVDSALSLDLDQLLPERDPFYAADVYEPPFYSLTYSIHVSLWRDAETAQQHLTWAQQMGFSHVKQVFAWEDLEPEPGVWVWMQADRVVEQVETNGLRLIVRLGVVPDWAHTDIPSGDTSGHVDAPPTDLDSWHTYCAMVAGRYAGRIQAYQIWNEPNLTREWGNKEPDASAYVSLLRVCSSAIRAADPAAILISAGLAPNGQYNQQAHRDDMYLQAMYNNGFEQYVDVVGVHAPGFSVPSYGPDDAEEDGRGRWATFRRVEDLRKIMIANGDAERQMAILEVGYTIDPASELYHWYAVTEAQQAQYLAEAYRYASEHWRPWIGLMSAVYLAEPTWTPAHEDYWWALNDPVTGTLRPAFYALAQMEKICGDLTETPVGTEYGSCN